MDDAILRKAIQLNKSGNRAEARVLLEEITQSESDNLTAWFWLADSSESPGERVQVLQHALQYHPEDLQLQRALRKFEANLASEEQFFREIEEIEVNHENEEPGSRSDEADPPVQMGDILSQYLEEKEQTSSWLEEGHSSDVDLEITSTANPRPQFEVKKTRPPKNKKKRSARTASQISENELNGNHQGKAPKKPHPFWFSIAVLVSAFLLILLGSIWMAFIRPTRSAAQENLAETDTAIQTTWTIASEVLLTETHTPQPEATLTPQETLELTSTTQPRNPTQTPIIAATITPTPAVAEGEFIPLDSSSFNDFAWSSDGTYFGVATDKGIHIGGGRNFIFQQFIKADPVLPIRTFSFSEDEKYISAGFISAKSAEEYVSRVKLWNISNGAEISTLNYAQPRGDVDALAYSLDGNTLWTNALYDHVIKWRVTDGALLDVFELSASAVDYYDVVFAPDRRSFAAISLYDRLRLFDSETGELITVLGADKEITGAVYSPNSQYLAVSYQNKGEIRVWDLPSKQEYRLINTHTNGIITMAFNPFSRILAAQTVNGLIKFYDINTGEEIRVISRQVKDVVQLIFSPDDTMLAVRSGIEVQIWELQTDRLLVTFRISQ